MSDSSSIVYGCAEVRSHFSRSLSHMTLPLQHIDIHTCRHISAVSPINIARVSYPPFQHVVSLMPRAAPPRMISWPNRRNAFHLMLLAWTIHVSSFLALFPFLSHPNSLHMERKRLVANFFLPNSMDKRCLVWPLPMHRSSDR